MKQLTLLHSNDLHGDFLSEQNQKQLIGGVSMLSGYLQQVRKEEKNVLYCIAGDMFRGSVIDSEYKGFSTIEIMNHLAPDIVTLGNHETDYGVSHLLFLEKCAKFPIINANLYLKNTLVRLFQPHQIIEIDGMKILFIGVITEAVIRSTKNDTEVGSFVDVHSASEEIGKICNAYKSTDIDLTVLLTHIGFEEDKILASLLKKEWGVDVIIGGHSHTLLEKPEIVNDIVIVQAGMGTDQIGRFDLLIDTELNRIDSYQWKTIPITQENCPKDESIETIVQSYKEKTDKIYQRHITTLKTEHTHPSRFRQTTLGSLITDLIADSLALDVMLVASGSIRTDHLGPVVQYRDLLEAFPYDGPCIMMKMTGHHLMRMMKYMLRDEVWQGKHSGFFQISKRLKITYSIQNHKFIDFLLDGKSIDPNKIYKIGMMQYHYNSFENYFGFSKEEFEKINPSVTVSSSTLEILEEMFSTHSLMSAEDDQRLLIL